MKISFNGNELLTLSETQKKVIQNDIPSEIFEFDMHRRLIHMIEHPCFRSIDLHQEKWRNNLKGKLQSIPADPRTLPFVMSMHNAWNDQDVLVSSDVQSLEVDDKLIFSVMPTTRKLIAIYLNRDEDGVIEHLTDRLSWILRHKYERCMERLRKEWLPKLIDLGIAEVPLDDDEFAEFIFAQPTYKNRSQRDLDEKINGIQSQASK